MNQIVWASQIGVVGTVVSTETVPNPDYPSDTVNAVLEVESVLFAHDTWEHPVPKPGETVEFHNYAVTSEPGASVGGLPTDVGVGDRYGQPLPIGTRVLLMLGGGDIDSLTAPWPAHGYQSMWVLSADGLAVSVQPSRTVELSALLAKIEAERVRGLIDSNADPAAFAEDARTANNPLGADEPAPTAPPTLAEPQRTLPVIVEEGSIRLTVESGTSGTAEALFAGTESGGAQIQVELLDESGHPIRGASGEGGPTVDSLMSNAVVSPLPSGGAVVAAVGAAGAPLDGVQVLVNGEAVTPVTGTWEREGTRPVIAFVVPKAAATIRITGLSEHTIEYLL